MIEDLYSIQLHLLYYKLKNTLLPSYFRSFTPYFNKNHTHDLRHDILRLPMTRREYFTQCTKYHFLLLIGDTPQADLERSKQSNIVQFSGYFNYSIINYYNHVCRIRICHACR